MGQRTQQRQRTDINKKSDSEKRQDERRRFRRVRLWLTLKSTQFALMLWCTIAQKLMQLHFILFQGGAIHQTHEDGRTCLTRFVHLPESPVTRIVGELHQAVEDPHSAMWEPLKAFFGPMTAWPPEMLELMQAVINITFGRAMF